MTTPVISTKSSPSFVDLGLAVPSRGAPIKIASGFESRFHVREGNIDNLKFP